MAYIQEYQNGHEYNLKLLFNKTFTYILKNFTYILHDVDMSKHQKPFIGI